MKPISDAQLKEHLAEFIRMIDDPHPDSKQWKRKFFHLSMVLQYYYGSVVPEDFADKRG